MENRACVFEDYSVLAVVNRTVVAVFAFKMGFVSRTQSPTH